MFNLFCGITIIFGNHALLMFSCYLRFSLTAVLLLWIIYVISVLFYYAFMHVCLLMPCCHLLGKG